MTSARPSLGLFGGKAGHIHPGPEARGVPAGGHRPWVNQALAPPPAVQNLKGAPENSSHRDEEYILTQQFKKNTMMLLLILSLLNLLFCSLRMFWH